VLGKGSGLDSVAIWLDQMGIPWDNEEQLQAILTEVKGRSLAKKDLLDEDEFREIADQMLPGSGG
jgi:hypothetical protein